MAAEGKMDEPRMEHDTSQIQEQGNEPSKNPSEKVEEMKNKSDGEESSKVKQQDDNKTKEIVVTEENHETTELEKSTSANEIEKSSSLKEESNHLSDLREHEKRALLELKSKIEEAILENKIFNEKRVLEKKISMAKDGKEKHKPLGEESPKEDVEENEKSKPVEDLGREEEKKESGSNDKKEEETPVKVVEKDITTNEETGKKDGEQGEKEKDKVVIEENGEATKEDIKPDGRPEEHAAGECKKEMNEAIVEEKGLEVDKDIAIWGVPLLPSKGDKRTDVILLKFLRAREFSVNDAFAMLRKSLQWRKENNIDSILDEEFDADLSPAAYMEGKDREGHPICYNLVGILGNDELYGKTLGNDEKREKFLRWRIQLMEKGIQKLDFNPGGKSAMLQINDLRNTPGPTKKEVRLATRRAVELLQDNYPEFVAKNIFINIPFWYYAFSALLSPFLTQRTKNKFVYARASKVTDTLLKYIPAEQIPARYGGLKRENDSEFSIEEAAKETIVKAGSTETIEIPATEVGNTLIWEVTVSGWEVNYKEEFVPTDEGSYTIIVQKGRKVSWQEGTIRNSFKNNEVGKIVITIENGSFKKKRILYRYKIKNLPSSSSS